jgi:hypothetical protein
MPSIFSAADRRMFSTAHRILGAGAEGLILCRLADGVFGDGGSDPGDAGHEWICIDEPLLRIMGLDELSMLPDISAAGCITRKPCPSGRVLRSLRASLLGPGCPGMDLQIRAGLHRLGRATADLDASVLQGVTRQLPADWARCAKAAWFRLSRLEECRASAATLRDLMTNGDR